MPTKDELPDAAEFAARFRKILGARGYADRGGQDRLAKLLGVKPPTVSAWLGGRHLPSAMKVQRLCTLWDVEFEWLYWGKGKPPAETTRPIGVRDQQAPYGSPAELRIAIQSLVTSLASNIPAVTTGFAARLRNRAAAEGVPVESGLLAELLGIAEQDHRKGAKEL